MKYYRKPWVNGCEHSYDLNNLPINKPIWAFAYTIKHDTAQRTYYSLPVRGEINKHGTFRPYKKKGDLSGSKYYNFNSRSYADTYEEAAEMYDELVQKRIDRLKAAIEDAKKDFITVVNDVDGWYE